MPVERDRPLVGATDPEVHSRAAPLGELRFLRLDPRVVVAPMHQYAAHGGVASDWHLVNAGRWAMGGAGLVVMESTKIERRGCGTVGDLGLWDDAFITPLRRIVDLYAAQGKPASCIVAYERALKLDPTPQQRIRLRLTLGEKLQAAQRPEDARKNYEKLLEEMPDYADALSIRQKITALSPKPEK